MALRKFLFQNASEGFFEEFQPNAGVDQLDANGGFINNVAGPPTVGTQAANKDYVDAVAKGLDPKASCRVKSVANMPDAAVKALLDFTGLGCPLLTTTVKAKVAGIDGNLLTVTVVGDSPPAGGVTIGEVGNATTIHYENGVSTEAQVEAAITASSTLLDVFTAGGGVVAIGPGGWGPTNLASGLDSWTYSGTPNFTLQASTDSVLNNVFDGVTVVAGVWPLGDRVLVTMRNGPAPDTDNGIYVVTTLGNGAGAKLTLTRADDFNTSAKITAGAFTFVTEGTATADKGFVLVTNDPITLDTTPLLWAQFSSTTFYLFNQGLTETGGVVKVDLDTAAGAQTVGAGGGSSGLEFDVNMAVGKLRAAVNATGGLSRTASGLGVLIDPLANTAGNAPSVATGAPGVKVLTAPKVQDNYIANAAIPAQNAVSWAAGVSNKLVKAQAGTDALAHPIGVNITAAGALNDTLAVVSEGVAVGALNGLGFVANDPVYLADAGGFTTFGSVTKRVILMGYAKNPTDLFVDIRDYGKKA